MTLLPLGRVRFSARSHLSALYWMWLLYRRSEKVEEAEKRLLYTWGRVEAWLAIYFHSLPYWAIACWLLVYVGVDLRSVPQSVISVVIGFAFGIVGNISVGLIPLIIGTLFGVFFGLSVGAFGLIISLVILVGISFGFDVLFSVSLLREARYTLSRALLMGAIYSLAVGVFFNLVFNPGRELGIASIFGIASIAGFLRAYYLLLYFSGFFHLAHFLFRYLGPLPGVPDFYRFHPAAWDSACLVPFPGLDQLLVRYAERDLRAGEHEIERLIKESPIQRPAALRARAILISRRAAEVTDLARIDEILSSLPVGERDFQKSTPELRRRVHEITSLQALLNTLDRPFLREPFAALLVKEIEAFEQQSAGFEPPLSIEFPKAARQWLRIASHQLQAVRAASIREPTHQVFRAGDPVDREREAFVRRFAILGELERQVMLATGCPGLLVYGRRRMGKSTLLRNLEGMLPPRVLIVSISMQEARAFTSTNDLVTLICQRISTVLPYGGKLPADLKGLEEFLDVTQKRLELTESRLLLAIDEYEFLDSKIGEGALSKDLLAVIRESIQTHRYLIWAFTGSHGIDEMVHAPWTSYLVSARTIEVTPFESEETRLLLTEPLKHSSLWRASGAEPPRFEPGFWGEGGIERIHAEAGGWPHLVQLVAETVVDLVNDVGSSSVDNALLERALDRAIVRGNNVFLELLERESRLSGEWDYLRGFRKVREQAVPGDEALDRSLRRRQLVFEQDGLYRLRVPLMARWLRQRV